MLEIKVEFSPFSLEFVFPPHVFVLVCICMFCLLNQFIPLYIIACHFLFVSELHFRNETMNM